MVTAMRNVSKEITMDIHLCVERPQRYIKTLAKAGANCIIFQIEALDNIEEAIAFGNAIKMSGMQAGISINPSTSVEFIMPLLSANVLDVIDILAVEPGFGGQQFQESVAGKVAALRKIVLSKGLNILLMVDGGMNDKTSPRVISLGADIIVAGTYLFRHNISMEQGAMELLRAGHKN